MSTEAEIVNQVLTTVSEHGAVAVTEYTTFFAHSAIMWTLIGAGLTLAGLLTFVLGLFRRDYYGGVNGLVYAGLIVAFAGLMFVGSNFGTLKAPQAYAIHQLIGDVRG